MQFDREISSGALWLLCADECDVKVVVNCTMLFFLKDQMNLLLITKNEKKHYILIKDFNAFIYNQSKHKEKKHFCMFCLQCFSSEGILVKHAINCLTINGSQAINMPKQGDNILKFNNFHKNLPVPFVIYADFKAIMKKVQGCEQSEEMKKDKDRRSYTEAYHDSRRLWLWI